MTKGIRMRTTITLLAVGMFAPLLGACHAYVETPPAALVEPAPHILLLSSGSGGALTSADRRRLEDFIYTASYGRLDAIHVNVIGTDPRARYAVARSAMRMGVTPFKVKEVNAAGRRALPLRGPRRRGALHRACAGMSFAGDHGVAERKSLRADARLLESCESRRHRQ